MRHDKFPKCFGLIYPLKPFFLKFYQIFFARKIINKILLKKKKRFQKIFICFFVAKISLKNYKILTENLSPKSRMWCEYKMTGWKLKSSVSYFYCYCQIVIDQKENILMYLRMQLKFEKWFHFVTKKKFVAVKRRI